VGQIKRGQCNFFRRSKAHVLEHFDTFFAGEITIHFSTLQSINIKYCSKYFLPEGATKANDFLCSSILVVLLTHNFHIKTILLTNNFSGKNSSCFR